MKHTTPLVEKKKSTLTQFLEQTKQRFSPVNT